MNTISFEHDGERRTVFLKPTLATNEHPSGWTVSREQTQRMRRGSPRLYARVLARMAVPISGNRLWIPHFNTPINL